MFVRTGTYVFHATSVAILPGFIATPLVLLHNHDVVMKVGEWRVHNHDVVMKVGEWRGFY